MDFILAGSLNKYSIATPKTHQVNYERTNLQESAGQNSLVFDPICRELLVMSTQVLLMSCNG